MRNLKKVLAVLLALAMVASLAACGKNTTTATNTPSPTQGGSTVKDTPTPVPATPTPTPTPLHISVSLPSDVEHVAVAGENDNEMKYYEKLVKEINEYTNMDIEWQWTAQAVYYDDEHLGLGLKSGNLADVAVVGKNAEFLKAAEQGSFWDLAPYIDAYPNLKTISDAQRAEASYNGKMYCLPRSRNIARAGFGYRHDWLEKKNLAEPTTWDAFKEMLRVFSTEDPDGDGEDNTFGLALDSWAGTWDNILFAWLGVPNQWGLTADGNLIYKVETEEWKNALKEIHELYDLGYINNGKKGIDDFTAYGAGAARKQLLQTSKCGALIQCLDDIRKAEYSFNSAEVGISTIEEPALDLMSYIEYKDYGKRVYPWGGAGSNFIAVSKTNIKTEEQLKQVLNFLDKMNDGKMLNLIEYGWEGETYELDADGYVSLYDADKLSEKGVGSANYRFGFNQVPIYFTAEENARPVTTATSTDPIRVDENECYEDGKKYLVPNYGISYTSDKYLEVGADLDKIVADAELQFIKGEIDENGLNEAIAAWKNGGGDQVTKEMNELYQKTK